MVFTRHAKNAGTRSNNRMHVGLEEWEGEPSNKSVAWYAPTVASAAADCFLYATYMSAVGQGQTCGLIDSLLSWSGRFVCSREVGIESKGEERREEEPTPGSNGKWRRVLREWNFDYRGVPALDMLPL